MDETPVFLDLVPNKVADWKGNKTIRVRTTGSEKNGITAALRCTAAGKLLPPYIIFKRRMNRPLKNVKILTGAICTTQVNAWMEWIDRVWSPSIQGKPALLSLDTFAGHLTETVRAAFDKCGTKLLVIPGVCTSVLQPRDISINKPLKSYMRHSWGQYMCI